VGGAGHGADRGGGALLQMGDVVDVLLPARRLLLGTGGRRRRSIRTGPRDAPSQRRGRDVELARPASTGGRREGDKEPARAEKERAANKGVIPKVNRGISTPALSLVGVAVRDVVQRYQARQQRAMGKVPVHVYAHEASEVGFQSARSNVLGP
jgi:hypothetical protein